MITPEEILTSIIKKTTTFAADLLFNRIKTTNQELETQKKEAKNIDKIDSLKKIKKILTNAENIIQNKEIYLSSEVGFSSLTMHLEEIKLWCNEIRLRGLTGGGRELLKTYVSLDTYLVPKRSHMHPNEKKNKVSLIQAINDSVGHCIILGNPGAGKTTSMKKLCLSLLDNCFKVEESRIPVRILLRNLKKESSDNPITDFLAKIIPVRSTREEALNIGANSVTKTAFLTLIDKMNLFLVLDGFDEISDEKLKLNVLNEIRFYCSNLQFSKVAVTCRTGEFSYDINRTSMFEIAPLDDEQIKQFAFKMLDSKAEDFITAVMESPYHDTTVRPLILAQLCTIYERIEAIPDKPTSVYSMIVRLMLSDWDEQRSIIRNSAYDFFDKDRKVEFLSYLAFELTAQGVRGEFSIDQFNIAYRKVHKKFKLPDSDSIANEVADEIESQTGLLFRCGFDNFEFSHRSVQEYLTALYIIKLPSQRSLDKKHESLASELAIATCLSSTPSEYFSELILKCFQNRRITRDFYEAFVSRLILERPDFNTEEYPETPLAMFVILGNGINEDAHVSLFVKLFDRLADENSVSILGEYYSEVPSNGLYVTKLQRIKNHPYFQLPSYLNFRVPIDLVSKGLKRINR